MVAVAATPGKTKHFQSIMIDKDLQLLDCPGLVLPSFATTKAELVVNGILPVDQLRDFIKPSALVADRIPRAVFERMYGIQIPMPEEHEDQTRQPTAYELLQEYAILRGFVRSVQGNPDESRAARAILKDYVSGKLVYCHPPPGYDAKEFNAEYYEEWLLAHPSKKSLNPACMYNVPEAPKKPVNHFDDDFFNQKHVKAGIQGRNPMADFQKAKKGAGEKAKNGRYLMKGLKVKAK